MTPPVDPVALTRDLVRCPSVTPAEGGALALLAERLRPAGFAVDLLTFGAPGTADVQNLYARIGTGGPCLLFCGHTDVVPPGDPAAWRADPFAGAIADGYLYGRGAVDMKSGVAAFVAAALGHVATWPPKAGSIALMITGDEEGPAVNGTARLLDWALARGERFDACLVGEPSSSESLGDMIKIGRRGSLTGTLLVEGTQGHVAYPHRADNPIPALLRLAHALTASPLDAGSPGFDPSNLEIVTVDTGNPAANVIPGRTRARFNVRFNDRWTAATLEGELRQRLEVAAAGARYTLTVEPCNAHAFITEPGPFVTLVAEAILAETGRRPALSTTGGTSDARFLAPICPVLECGLVGRTMHMVDERVPVVDIEALTSLYSRIIRATLAAA